MNAEYSNGVAARMRSLNHVAASLHGIKDKREYNMKQEVIDYGYFVLYGSTGRKNAARAC